jgi:rare lipoprotein A
MAAAAVAIVAPGCALLRPQPEPPPVVSGTQVGVASWYGPGFHGRPTASGEIFDQRAMTAAHPSLPLGSRARVTSLTNDRAVHVRINDRGPFVGGRIVDLSYAAARELQMIGPGVMRVRLEVLDGPPAVVRTRHAPRRSPPAHARRVVPPVVAAAPSSPTYVVRLGTFGERQRADAVRRDVARRFPDARVTALDTGGTRTYGVHLGPYAARRSAEARAEIVGRLGYSAVVLTEPVR